MWISPNSPVAIRRLTSRISIASVIHTAISPIAAKPTQRRRVPQPYIGRSLEHGEVVHHMNGDASDNSPENLLIMPDRQHRQLHMALAIEQMEGGDSDDK